MAQVCPPCLKTLREMCRIAGAQSPQVCEIEARYAATGDPSLVEQASTLAPHVAFQARRQLKARGEL